MQTYQFETEILPKGIIRLPKEYDLLKLHKVKVIMIEKDELEKTQARDKKLFWDSFGSWQDERSADEIIKDIYEARKSSKRKITL